MKVLIAALICAGTLIPLQASRAQEVEANIVADRTVYGEYPLGYQQIIQNFLQERLLDFPSAKIDWLSKPEPVKLTPRKQRPVVGYAVTFRVNSRNRFGMYTGYQGYRMVIRNGEVVHVERTVPPKSR